MGFKHKSCELWEIYGMHVHKVRGLSYTGGGLMDILQRLKWSQRACMKSVSKLQRQHQSSINRFPRHQEISRIFSTEQNRTSTCNV